MFPVAFNRFRFRTLRGRHIETVVGGLLFACILTLLNFHILPAPTTLLLPAANENIRYDYSSSQSTKMKQCLPQKHIFFLKTHKCGSSTVQNIFLRYGYNNNLTFALPEEDNYLGSPAKFQASMMPQKLLPSDGKVDIFPVHTRLNAPEHKKVLHEDTRWITIVRDPVTLYESLFNFYPMRRIYRLKLASFAWKPLETLMKLPRFLGRHGRNQMLFDFGYQENISVHNLRRAIDEIDELFDLVMITELMDESLILLRHKLCWSLHDIVAFTRNARRQDIKLALDPEIAQTIKALNSADYLLYEHFLAKHQRAVYEFGIKRMADEVASLRGLQDEYYEDCGTREVKGKDKSLQFKEYSDLVNAYVATNNSNENCVIMSLPEQALINKLKSRQLATLSDKSS